jgi:competence protein ComGC
MERLKKLLKNQEGYGTVELLILVAALGLLAVGITGSLRTKLTDANDAGSAVNKVNSTITNLLNQASSN